MHGCYISDDYYFWIDSDMLIGLASSPNTFGSFESFVCPEKSGNRSVRMELDVRADHKREFSDFEIKVDYRKKVCTLIFTLENLQEWFIDPTPHVLENGPSIRFGSANVYIKTERSKDEFFKNMILGHLRSVPEKPYPNMERIRKLKSRKK